MDELRRLLKEPFGDCPTLTKREREIANLLAFGHTQVEVGMELGIAPGTVAALAGRAKAKLGGKAFTKLLLERIKGIVL